MPFGAVGVATDVITVDTDTPLGRLQEGGEHPVRGCLASAVGTQKAKDLARADLKVDVIHRQHRGHASLALPVYLGQPLYFNGARHLLLPPIPGKGAARPPPPLCGCVMSQGTSVTATLPPPEWPVPSAAESRYSRAWGWSALAGRTRSPQAHLQPRDWGAILAPLIDPFRPSPGRGTTPPAPPRSRRRALPPHRGILGSVRACTRSDLPPVSPDERTATWDHSNTWISPPLGSSALFPD